MIVAGLLAAGAGMLRFGHPPLAAPSQQRPHLVALEEPLANEALRLAKELRVAVADAEEELEVEVVHSKKFLCRGDGMLQDFLNSSRKRRRAIILGAEANEKALLAAMKGALAMGLPREYLKEANEVALALALGRAEIEREYQKAYYLGEGGHDDEAG